MSGRARLAQALALIALSAGPAGPAACGASGPRTANPTRPVDERRAIEVIRRALRSEGAKPGPAREVKLLKGATILVDVGVAGRDYGIAFVTREDAAALGGAIPPPNAKDERLRIVRAGDDGKIRVVLLYQDNYVFDDLAGEVHAQTSIAAEEELSRDVRDFVYHARSRKFR